MRARRKFPCLGCLAIVLLFAAAAAGGAAVLASRAPGVAAQVPPAPILLTLRLPPSESVYPAIGAIRVAAEAVAQSPIVGMELWADGTLAGSVSPNVTALNRYAGVWAWEPGYAGEHLLLVRALNAAGRSAQSNVVRLTARQDTIGFTLITHPAEAGDTAASVAEEYGAPLEQVLDINPGLAPDELLAPGQEVKVPLPPPAPPIAEPPPSPPQPSPSGPAASPPPEPLPWFVWSKANLLPAPSAPPPAPDLVAGAAGCSVHLYLTDRASDEEGFFLYRLGSAAGAFQRIAILGPNSGALPILHVDPDRAGQVWYYAASFNTAGETPGGIAGVQLDPAACPPSQWSGLTLEAGQFHPAQAVEAAYLYVSVNGRQHVRIPSQAETYLHPRDGAFDAGADVGKLLAAGQGDVTLAFEAWGWQAGELIYLGAGNGLIKSASLEGQPLVEASTLEVHSTSSWSDIQNLIGAWETEWTIDVGDQRIFRWTGGPPAADNGLWQVSHSPFPPGPPDAAPAGLAAFGEVGIDERTFAINFADVIGDAGPAAGAAPTPEVVPAWRWGQAPLTVKPGEQRALRPLFPPVVPRTYYVRIIPRLGSQPVGNASNTVVIHYGPITSDFEFFDLPLPDQPLYAADVLSFQPPVFPDPNLWGCVEIVENRMPAPFSDLFSPGEVLCPKVFRGGGDHIKIESFWDFLKAWIAAYDVLAEKLDQVKGLVVNLFDQFSPLCIQYRLAVEATGGALPEEGCKQAVGVALDAALAANGIPPRLPRYNELVDRGTDYLVELAAEQIENQTGVPCVGPCEEALRQGLRQATEQLKQVSDTPGCVGADEAHKHGREPLCLPDGVVAKPAKGSVYEPPIAVVRVMRRPEVPDPQEQYYPSCYLSVSMRVGNYFSGGPVYGPYSPTGSTSMEVPAQNVEGSLYAPVALPLPRLARGESLEIPLTFNMAEPFTFPWTEELYRRSQIPPDRYQGKDWFTLYAGGVATIRAAGGGHFDLPQLPIGAENYQCVIEDDLAAALPDR